MIEGIKLHPRHQIRIYAEAEHNKALLEIIQNHNLTYGEIFTLLSKSMRDWVSYFQKDEENK